jgi:phosphate transport system substrate-binding protein
MVRLLLAASVTLASLIQLSAAESLAAGGSTTVKPIVERAAKALKAAQPDLAITVAGGGSGAAVKGLLDGKLQVGALSRDLKEAEKTSLPDVVVTPIALDGLAMVVNPATGVSALTKQQVIDLYLGKVTNWKAIGGADVPVTLITVSEANGTHDLFLSSFKLKNQAATAGVVHAVEKTDAFGTAIAEVANTIQEAVLSVQKNPGAIVSLSIGTTHNAIKKGLSLKVVDLDGVTPNTDTVLSGAYPYRRSLILATKGAPTPGAKILLDWLTSTDGQKLVAELEFIPLVGK